ncbi:MAG: hypothetical protein HUK13_10240, partial [Muribaculaceae bacterium]|nr:hypothetical protein [Muribaculaceae bacterium]
MIEKSAWCDAENDSELKPGDKGVWYVNYADENVAEVRYWFETSWTTDWLLDNNGMTVVQGQQPYRKAVKTENGWMEHFWAYYQEVIPENETLTVHMLALDADGKKIGKNTITWANKDIYTPTLTYSMLTYDPAATSELETATTVINVKSEQDLSKLVAYTAAVYDKTQLDDQNLPKLLVDRIDYGVAKVNGKEWCIILKLTDEYLAATNGEVYLAVEAYDAEGYPAIDALYTLIEYNYAAAAKVAKVGVTPANGASLGVINQFTFANVDTETNGSVGRNWSNTEVASLKGADYEYVFTDSDWDNAAMTLSVPEAQRPTVPGVYVLDVPKGYFLVGDENPVINEAVSANYALKETIQYVNVNYVVCNNVAGESSVSTSDHKIVKGEKYGVRVQVPEGENWVVNVEGATLDGTTGLYMTPELNDDATVKVTYTAPVTEYVTVNCKVKTVV